MCLWRVLWLTVRRRRELAWLAGADITDMCGCRGGSLCGRDSCSDGGCSELLPWSSISGWAGYAGGGCCRGVLLESLRGSSALRRTPRRVRMRRTRRPVYAPKAGQKLRRRRRQQLLRAD